MSETKENNPEIVEEGKTNRVNLDTILVNEIGQFGWFQVRLMVLAFIIIHFGSWAANEYVFTTARIPTRCHIEECDGEEPNFNPDWLLNAIPGTDTSTGNFEQCSRYVSINASAQAQDACPLYWFNQNVQTSCNSQVYENTDTVVYDLDLGCDEWQRSLIGSIRTLGVFAAMSLTGFVSDRWGRRTALAICAFNTGWIGILRYFSNTYAGFVISQFAESLFGSGGFSCAYILIMEAVGPKYRVAAGASLNTIFSMGQMTMGLIAWAVPNWRHLTLALYAPMLITVFFYWLLTESVRWYMSKGRYEEAEETLKKIARINGKELSDKSLEALKMTSEEEKKKQAQLEEEKKNEPLLIVQVFRHKRILLRCCIIPVWWVTNTFIYYGLSINAVNMSGNRYVNYIAVAAASVPGYWTAVLLLDRIGRKPVLLIAFWICAACQIAYIFLPDEQYALSLTVYLIGTFCIAMVMTSIYVYTTELFPTKYRHNLFGFCSMIGRIGAILAPLTPALGSVIWDELPFALFAFFAILSGVLLFFSPETRGHKLPDTMEEASNIEIKKEQS